MATLTELLMNIRRTPALDPPPRTQTKPKPIGQSNGQMHLVA